MHRPGLKSGGPAAKSKRGIGAEIEQLELASQTCRQPLSQNSRMSHAVLSFDIELPLRFELLLGLEDIW